MDKNHYLGCLLGMAVGDAIGLPVEGLPPRRRQRLFGEVTSHRLFLGRGLVSDDTAHAIMTAQALVASGGDPERFGRELATRLKHWFLSLPPGTGRATAHACLKLLAGASPKHSGVFSAGNGPAMRAPIIGLFCASDSEDTRLRALIHVSTCLTHTDPKAEEKSLELAKAMALPWVTKPIESIELEELRGPISGYIVHTVDAVLALASDYSGDLRRGVIKAVALGGDTDTVAALVGALIGARVGQEGIPTDWLAGLIEPWWSIKRLEQLAQQLAQVAQTGTPQKPVPNAWLTTHALLLPIVLAHGFRRLLPPY